MAFYPDRIQFRAKMLFLEINEKLDIMAPFFQPARQRRELTLSPAGTQRIYEAEDLHQSAGFVSIADRMLFIIFECDIVLRVHGRP